MLLKINVQNYLKSLTKRKMLVSYYHSLTRHSVEQYRLFSGQTTNTEHEEATFNELKRATNLSSNHHPDNIILNDIIRSQARKMVDLNENKNKDSFGKNCRLLDREIYLVGGRIVLCIIFLS